MSGQENITDLHNVVQYLFKELASLQDEVKSLKSENALLREKLSRYEHPKNSGNSSLPPSKDPIGKRIKSLRKPSGKKPGGQVGHEGSTLEFKKPDVVEILSPTYCNSCGCSLEEIDREILEVRQQVDIPPIVPVVTEFRLVAKQCCCGHSNQGDFPSNVNSPVSFGANIEALVCYLNVCHHIPYKRLSKLFNEVFNQPISEGTIDNILNRMQRRTAPAYETIRKMISTASVVGVDETSTAVNGKNVWSWVFQTPKATYLTSGRTRKISEFTDIMPGGLPDSILNTDCYSGYFSQEVASHQICTAHLLRDLNYLQELYESHQWASRIKDILYDAIQERQSKNGTINETPFRERLQKLLDENINPKKYPKVCTLQKRLKKYKDYIFTFLKYQNVPPDNNASERAIRVFKIKTKVSGFFKSMNGSQRFAQLHSIADTARKNMQSPFNVFHLAVKC